MHNRKSISCKIGVRFIYFAKLFRLLFLLVLLIIIETKVYCYLYLKVIEMADVDDLVLGNWVSQGTTGGMSILENREVLFPTIQVGSYVSQWITVKNPSPCPVIMQLILNSGEIIDECRGPDGLVRPSSSGNLVLDDSTTPTKYGFSTPGAALTEAFVHPYDHVSLGPIIFYPSDRCGWSGSALIRNNLSGVEWLSLRGFGGSLSLVLLEKSEHVQSVDFNLEMPRSLNFTLPYAFMHMKEMNSACSQPLVKELYAKNTGDLPLEVLRIKVSGRDCGLDGFKIHSCGGFVLEPGESTKLLISYQTDFSAAMIHRDLELALGTGIFLIPMKANFPHDMLSNCKRSMVWMRLKKFFLGFLLVVSLICLVFCLVFPQTIALGSLYYSCKGDHGSIHTIKNAEKTNLLHHNQRKSKLSMSDKMHNLLYPVGEGSTMEASCVGRSCGQGESCVPTISQHLKQATENHKQNSHLLDTPNERKLLSTVVRSSDAKEASQLGNLMVSTGKERGKRRRKRKSLSAKLAGLSEVSSSQSGNSTPSSPISPVTSVTSKCNWPLSPDLEQPLQARTSITQRFDDGQASVSAAKANILDPEFSVECCVNNLSIPTQGPHLASTIAADKPVQIPSATSPSRGGPSPLALTSTAPHARAPGSKIHNQTAVQVPKAGLADEYTYDIWGDHFSGLHLLLPRYVTRMKSSPAENNFDSFFVRGPRTPVTNSQEG